MVLHRVIESSPQRSVGIRRGQLWRTRSSWFDQRTRCVGHANVMTTLQIYRTDTVADEENCELGAA